jgi:hypothetical protein
MSFLEIGAALLGGLMQSDSASDAADAQAGASAASIAEQRRQYDLTRGDYAPYRTIGTNALRRLGALYGVGGGAGGGLSESEIRAMLTGQYTTPGTPGTPGGYFGGGREGDGTTVAPTPGTPSVIDQAGLEAAVRERMGQQGGGTPQVYNDGLDDPIEMDPGYQFGLTQGQQALDRKAAAAGGRVSGAALKAAGQFATNYATTGYNSAYQRRQDRINRLAELAGIGQTSTAASAAAGGAAANNISNALSSQGNAAGAASLAQGNIWGNALNQAGAAWQRRPINNQAWGTTGDSSTMGFGGVY